MRKLKKRTFSGTTNPDISDRELRNRKLTRATASQGMVLLKNEHHLLPLDRGKALALFGAGASRTVKGGTGSGDVNERKSVSIAEGLKNAGFSITSEDWIRDYDRRYQEARDTWRDSILRRVQESQGATDFFTVYSTTPFIIPAGGDVTETDTDTAVYVISRTAGEGADRYAREGDYYLTAEERKQLSDVCCFYEHVIVAINTGGLIDLSFLDEEERIEAVLYIAQPGMEGGNAFADILLGEAVPSAKLTDSWPLRYEDIPGSEEFSHNDGNVEQAFYREGIFAGYRYFDTFDVPVRFGFGYGLSYSEFRMDVTSVEADEPSGRIRVLVEVENTGAVRGKEVVQVYVTPPAGRLVKEYRRLAAFGKTALLAPGEKETLELTIPLMLLSSYDMTAPGFLMEAGSYVVWVGNSLSASSPAACMTLDADVLLEKTENVCPLKQELEELAPEEAYAREKLDALMQEVQKRRLPVLRLSGRAIGRREVKYLENALLVSKEASAFVDTLTEDQLVKLACGDPGTSQAGNLGAAGVSVPGSAGETSSCALEQNLAAIVLADGPAGLRLTNNYDVDKGRIVPQPFEASIEGGIFCREAAEALGVRYYQYCTAIPVGICLAQTWDTELVCEVGEMIGAEMQEFGVTLWLAPGMNIHRNPLCGRNFEYYSEDPVVAGRIAAAMTKGVQKNPGCGTTIKHFACNNMEDNRKAADSILSERALREIYLRGFEIAVKEAQPMAIMTSYNLINGVHAANSGDLCTKIVRCEWGFRGIIMTDWTTTNDGPECTASGCMRAGNDLVMPGFEMDMDNLKEELEKGTLSIRDLKACAARLTDIIWKSNQYEGAVPYGKV